MNITLFNSLKFWRWLQVSLMFIGILLVTLLIFKPDLGIQLFWNGLIPIAPALLVLCAGIWRNICPLSNLALIPRKLGLSKKKKLPNLTRAKLNLIGLVILFLTIPFRHIILDTNGPLTGILLIVFGLIAFYFGTQYEWKSAWCSGMCPIYHVEKLYGSKPLASMPNSHCKTCEKCLSPCPDSTSLSQPIKTKNNSLENLLSSLMYGGFPGFIWGWFQVKDHTGILEPIDMFHVFAYPIFGLCFTHGLFLWMKGIVSEKNHIVLNNSFAAASVSIYYIYRIPALLGFGVFPGDGMIVDLTNIIPYWLPIITGILTTYFFFWWFLIRNSSPKSWSYRPPFTHKNLNTTKP